MTPSPSSAGDLIDVGLAKRVASRLASSGLLPSSYLLHDIEQQMSSLVQEASPLVEEETGFHPQGEARAVLMSRAEWAAANIGGITSLMAPFLSRVEEKMEEGRGGVLARRAYRPALGLQLGAVMGFISQRVLGQYDLLSARAGEIWFVGTNLVVMERRMGFVPRDFRLWVAMHEVTHRVQFEANPWLGDHFLSSVKELMESIPLDLGSLLGRLSEAVRSKEGSPAPALLGGRERKLFEDLQGFMSLIEGHANFVMDRAAEGKIPTQPRMRRTLRSRAALEGPLATFLRRLLGLDLKRMQYEEGQRFVECIFEKGGRPAVATCFSSPQILPTLDEIRSPDRWLARSGV